MTRSEQHRLDTGNSFPELHVSTTNGRSLVLPGEFVGQWAVLLFYRGDW